MPTRPGSGGGTPRRTGSRRSARPATPSGDWAEIKAAGDDLNERLAAALRAGVAADDPAAMDLAEEHRQQLNRYFYDCGHEFHRNLGDMYVDDPRFTATYDAVTPGLATYLRDAIHANAARATSTA